MAGAGHETGLLVRTYKLLGRGEDAQLVEEYKVDDGLLRELRELEKHSATELGQWMEKQEHSGQVAVQRIVEVAVTMPKEPD